MKTIQIKTKEDEIQVLLSLLAMPTYFQNEFDQDTVALMCENIRNDFPLMQGTGWYKYNAEADVTIAALEAKVNILEAENEKLDVKVANLQNAVQRADEFRERAEKCLLDRYQKMALDLGRYVGSTAQANQVEAEVESMQRIMVGLFGAERLLQLKLRRGAKLLPGDTNLMDELIAEHIRQTEG